MRTLNGHELPPGSTLLWRNPTDRAYLRWGIVALVVATAGIAGTAGYFAGHHHARKRNPKGRRR